MSTSNLDYRTTITYSGPYEDADCNEHQASDTQLAYGDEEREDRSAGILGNVVYAIEVGKEDVDENVISIDLQLWCEAACEQSGGHNYISHQWSEEPESACQICTRCGSEIDPA